MFRYISRIFARQVIRRIAVIAVGALFMLVPALWGGLQAHAASPQDDWFRQSPNLVTGQTGYGGYTCELDDRSNDFYTTALEADWGARELDKESLQNAINGDGRWIVSQHIDHYQNNPAYGYSIIWTEDDSLGLIWSVQDEVRATGNDIKQIYIRTRTHYQSWSPPEGCNEFVGTDGSIWSWTISNKEVTSGPSRTNILNFFAYVDEENKNIPDGYNGDLPRDTPPGPPLSGENYAPNWTILTANNWKAEIRDLRFATFDGIPWTCSEDGNSIQSGHEGLAPVIEWKLYNQNNSIIDEGILSATAHWNYQFPEQNMDTTYTITGKYNCGGDVNFSAIGEKEFTITETGLLKEQDFFADCIMLEPPFIAVQACIENVFRVIEILSFNQINLVQGFNSTENCRQLVVLGNWINKPYEVVCPQFSEDVRNTVTPFVTFILGLFTAMIIMRVMNNRGIS